MDILGCDIADYKRVKFRTALYEHFMNFIFYPALNLYLHERTRVYRLLILVTLLFLSNTNK